MVTSNPDFLFKVLKRSAVVMLLLAIVVCVAHIYVLSQRQDGEQLFMPGESVEITGLADAEHTVLICLDETVAPFPEAVDVVSSPMTDASDNTIVPYSLEMTPARVFEWPAGFLEQHELPDIEKCSVSDAFVTEGERLHLDTPKSALVLDAYSESQPSTLDRACILIFLFALMVSLSLASRTRLLSPGRRIAGHPMHGVLAFMGALVCIYAFTKASMPFIGDAQTLLPGFGEMFVALTGNFAAFLGVSGLVYLWWCRTASQREKGAEPPAALFDKGTEPLAEYAPTPDAVQAPQRLPDADPGAGGAAVSQNPMHTLSKDSVLLPIGLAFGLVIVAVASVVVAPLPGLSTAEIASQLVGTRFLTAYFAILAGVCEECLFRGVIQTSLMPGVNARHPKIQHAMAIAFATALFVLLHVPQSLEHLWALIPITLVSVVSGILRMRSGAIYQSILLHITYNSILLMPGVLFALDV